MKTRATEPAPFAQTHGTALFSRKSLYRARVMYRVPVAGPVSEFRRADPTNDKTRRRPRFRTPDETAARSLLPATYRGIRPVLTVPYRFRVNDDAGKRNPRYVRRMPLRTSVADFTTRTHRRYAVPPRPPPGNEFNENVFTDVRNGRL